jgi:hypothetical protein
LLPDVVCLLNFNRTEQHEPSQHQRSTGTVLNQMVRVVEPEPDTEPGFGKLWPWIVWDCQREWGGLGGGRRGPGTNIKKARHPVRAVFKRDVFRKLSATHKVHED